MQITFKTVTNKQFKVEAGPSDTIRSLKDKIKDIQGFAPEHQKIIYSGKILDDARTVEECKIKEKDFLVVMSSKPKPAPSSASTSSAAPAAPSASSASTSGAAASAPAPAPSATPAETPSATNAPAAAPAQPEAPTQAEPAFGDQSTFLTGSRLESAMQNMIEMGFEKDQVQRAMRASFNNPDRAVEYLMSGIPAHLQQAASGAPAQQEPSQASAIPSSTTGPTGGESAAPVSSPSLQQGGARSGNLFEAAAAAAAGGEAGGAAEVGAGAGGGGQQVIDLGNPAMLGQLRQLVQQNPAALQPILQAIAQSNPQLAQALNQNPEALMAALLGGEGDFGDEEGMAEEYQTTSINDLSEEERAAVERIQAVGLSPEKALECYLICGKNEEHAINYYFEHMQDED